jgi:predicted esterase/catechol 2,3-dioxygenase-like lactoylglutathione lyase family enzyme
VLAFRGPDGILLELVAHPGAQARPAWGGAPGIPQEHAIRGIHSVALWVESGEPTGRVLAEVLGLRAVGASGSVRRYAAEGGGAGGFIDVREIGGFVRAEEGVGTVHHVALRVADEVSLIAMRQRLRDAGLEPSEVIDRHYFRSVYVREPGGILLELATDGPGFTIDEPVSGLGRSLRLPPHHEGERAAIEAALPPLRVPGLLRPDDLLGGDVAADTSPDALDFVHRYFPPAEAAGQTARTTLLLLHGTGGDENDLLPLGRLLLPGAGLLSPRGQVMENGMPRFFRRHAMGVLDQADLERRTAELADFIDQAANVYAFERGDVVAVGFSNGANLAASLLLRSGAALRAAVLLSPMLPFEPEALPDLAGLAVFLGAGRADPLVPAEQVERLAALLERAGAEVTVHWEAGGHAITRCEVDAARRWLADLTTADTAASDVGPA